MLGGFVSRIVISLFSMENVQSWTVTVKISPEQQKSCIGRKRTINFWFSNGALYHLMMLELGGTGFVYPNVTSLQIKTRGENVSAGFYTIL